MIVPEYWSEAKERFVLLAAEDHVEVALETGLGFHGLAENLPCQISHGDHSAIADVLFNGSR